MSGFLTTHVLDTAKGCPAANLKIELFRIIGNEHQPLRTLATNDDGRTDSHILPAEEFTNGTYELVFHAGDYLRANGATDADIKKYAVMRGVPQMPDFWVGSAEAFIRWRKMAEMAAKAGSLFK